MGPKRKWVFVAGLSGLLVLWLSFCAIVARTIDRTPPRVYLLFGVPGGWGLLLVFLALWLREVRSWLHRVLVCVPFLVFAWLVVRLMCFSHTDLLSVYDFMVVDLLVYIGPCIAVTLGIGCGCLWLWRRLSEGAGGVCRRAPMLSARMRSLVALVLALVTMAGLGASYAYTQYVGPWRRQHRGPERYEMESRTHIRVIVHACWSHLADSGHWPATLEELVQAGYLDQGDLQNPRWPRQRPGYLYFKPTGTVAGPDDVVLCEAYKGWPENGVLVGLDWNTVIVVKTEEELERMLGGKPADRAQKPGD
jgi:hypothetical protein